MEEEIFGTVETNESGEAEGSFTLCEKWFATTYASFWVDAREHLISIGHRAHWLREHMLV